VLDWLTCDVEATWLSPADYPGPELQVQPSAGHALAAAACHVAALAMPLTDPAVPYPLPPTQHTEAQCNGCGVYPIVGVRYKSLSPESVARMARGGGVGNLNLCQTCREKPAAAEWGPWEQSGTAGTVESRPTPDERQAYVLRHAVAHLCLAADTVRKCDAWLHLVVRHLLPSESK
jgi:hypothetical protein